MLNYKPRVSAKCPHCQTTVRFEVATSSNWNGSEVEVRSKIYRMISVYSQCPECMKFVVEIKEDKFITEKNIYENKSIRTVWPLTAKRDPVPSDVPTHIAQEYNEAAQVLTVSAKASAALSRRCLQTILREAGGTKSKDLADQIRETSPTLPTWIADNLDAVRSIGNFAAHPMKSQATGTIIDVETGEAEWNLDVLDALFDHYFVRPEAERKKRDALNKKLKDAGKPTI